MDILGLTGHVMTRTMDNHGRRYETVMVLHAGVDLVRVGLAMVRVFARAIIAEAFRLPNTCLARRSITTDGG